MFQITGVIQEYAWGSTRAIPQMLGTEVTGRPQAEYWLGTHSTAPARTPQQRSLAELIDTDPSLVGAATAERFGNRLPYLLKLLAADHALSLQAHPSAEQAEEGFARENEAGIPLDAPHRNYKDPWPKPETLVALTRFEGLSGFRAPERTIELFGRLGVPALSELMEPLIDPDGIARVFLEVLELAEDEIPLIHDLVAAATANAGADGEFGEFCRTAVTLAEQFPDDPGILAALLMNRITLEPGEAAYMPAGKMHAYLSGTGIEVMSNSDNVLRGGLTAKHIDVDELARVVDFAAEPPSLIAAFDDAPGVIRYDTHASQFRLYRLSAECELPAPGTPRIVFVVEGTAELAGADAALHLGQGGAAFVSASDPRVRINVRGVAFVAAPGI